MPFGQPFRVRLVARCARCSPMHPGCCGIVRDSNDLFLAFPYRPPQHRPAGRPAIRKRIALQTCRRVLTPALRSVGFADTGVKLSSACTAVGRCLVDGSHTSFHRTLFRLWAGSYTHLEPFFASLRRMNRRRGHLSHPIPGFFSQFDISYVSVRYSLTAVAATAPSAAAVRTCRR